LKNEQWYAQLEDMKLQHLSPNLNSQARAIEELRIMKEHPLHNKEHNSSLMKPAPG
jgi:hypothetical protein